MKKSDLKRILDENDIPENVVYELEDTKIGDLLGVEQSIMGWSVYYSERGSKYILKSFDQEDAACAYFLAKIAQRKREDYGRDVLTSFSSR